MAISDINENFPIEGIDQPSTGFRNNFGHIKDALNSLDSDKEPTITAGTTSQYLRGDKTFQALNTTAVAEGSNLYHTVARVRATVLTGLSTATNSAALAADSILVAIGKLQAQVTARASLAVGNLFTSFNRVSVTTTTGGATFAPNLQVMVQRFVTNQQFTISAPTNVPATGIYAEGDIYIIYEGAHSLTSINAAFKKASADPFAPSNTSGQFDIIHWKHTGTELTYTMKVGFTS